MLSIRGLKSGYAGAEILHGLDVEIKLGEISTIIGPNGSGKSTLLKSIFNLCDIYSGEIKFKDKNITSLPTYELISEGISYVPQGRQVFSDMTVKENLEMGAFIMRDKEVVQRNLADIFEKFPFLKQKANEYAFSLSGGQQQMLSIARALIQDPELILMDEPSLGLSPKTMGEVFEKIKEINKEDVTVLIVEQNAKAAAKIADKIIVLEQGRIALSGGKELLKSKKLENIYFGGE
ncbi:MAG: ABC transporter ATP-binding protein [Candidatus Diapherotrites archaeon]|nr:ABC transporter ATP-binding protein [Candidatus Diapherotrites archaeon]